VRGMGAGILVSSLCAVLAAMGNSTANVMQRKASLEQTSGRRFGLGLFWDLAQRPTWLLGIGGMVASFVLQALALGLGQLSAVETIITLEVPLTLLIASRVFHATLGRSEWGAVLVMTVGMIDLVASLHPRPGNEADVAHTTYAVAGGATVATIAALVLAARRGHRIWRTACLGAATGTSFGLTAALMKETTAQWSTRGVLGMVSTWQGYAAVGFGVLGLIVMQGALHLGPLLAAQPGFTLMDPLVSIFWGVFVYHEVTRTGPWLAPACFGAAAIGVGVALLARSPLLIALNEHDIDEASPAGQAATATAAELADAAMLGPPRSS
jgi:drug/metabolite transporter (DMT)-like permease